MGNIDITGKEDDVLPQDITINQTIINPKFNRIRKEADIALIQLKEPAKIERHVQPACLYTKSDTPDNMVSVGWGRLGLSKYFFFDLGNVNLTVYLQLNTKPLISLLNLFSLNKNHFDSTIYRLGVKCL